MQPQPQLRHQLQLQLQLEVSAISWRAAAARAACRRPRGDADEKRRVITEIGKSKQLIH